MYKDKGEKLVLVLLLESHSELNTILIGTSRHSFYSISYHLLTTYFVNHCSNQIINNLVTRNYWWLGVMKDVE